LTRPIEVRDPLCLPVRPIAAEVAAWRFLDDHDVLGIEDDDLIERTHPAWEDHAVEALGFQLLNEATFERQIKHLSP